MGRVVRYVRAELSATGRAVHGLSCPLCTSRVVRYGPSCPWAELFAMYEPSCPLRAELSMGRVVRESFDITSISIYSETCLNRYSFGPKKISVEASYWISLDSGNCTEFKPIRPKKYIGIWSIQVLV